MKFRCKDVSKLKFKLQKKNILNLKPNYQKDCGGKCEKEYAPEKSA